MTKLQTALKYLCDICYLCDRNQCETCILNPENQFEDVKKDSCENCLVTRVNDGYDDLSPEEWEMSEAIENAIFTICSRCKENKTKFPID